MEPFKNHIDAAVVRHLAERIPGTWDRERFIRAATDGLEALELKGRVVHVADALREALPPAYPEALEQILAGLDAAPTGTDQLTSSWWAWPLCTFVERHGLEHTDLSLAAMEQLTGHWSCEFAVRPFFARDPDRVLEAVERWSCHSSVHLRRLASEGTRPRLPWGIRLQQRIEQPEQLLPVLARLKDDRELYVRRSVANHLNDIAKDHPDWVIQVCGEWAVGADRNLQRLVKHALRTHIKAGDPRAYALIGLSPFSGEAELELHTPQVRIGAAIEITARLQALQSQRVRLDLGVHFLKANGSHTIKVFHWTERTIPGGEIIELSRSQPMKRVTTRKLYAGKHRIDLRINGRVVPGADFELQEM